MDKLQNISLKNLADQVIQGEFGDGAERKKKLGILYPLVQNLVNEKYLCQFRHPIDDNVIEELAKMTMKGKFGTINTRKANLDYIYPRVQEKLIELVKEDLKNKKIKDIVKEVKHGKHGDDEYRKEILGDLYNIVQNKVNESMGNDERYELNERNIEI